MAHRAPQSRLSSDICPSWIWSPQSHHLFSPAGPRSMPLHPDKLPAIHTRQDGRLADIPWIRKTPAVWVLPLPRKFHTTNIPRIRAHTTIVHLAVFLLSPHRHLRPVPSTRRSGTNALTPTAKKTFACGGLSVGGLTAQHHPLQLPCPGALADCFGNRNRYQLSPNKVASP